MQPRFNIILFLGLLAASHAIAADQSWVDESNQNAQLILEMQARYSPENAASRGVEGYDDNILDLKPGVFDRQQEDRQKLIVALNQILVTAEHPKVIQDLEILIDSTEDSMHTAGLNREHMLPYYNLPQGLFYGFSSLLDERVYPDRYPLRRAGTSWPVPRTGRAGPRKF